jgi:hypothetical protein
MGGNYDKSKGTLLNLQLSWPQTQNTLLWKPN